MCNHYTFLGHLLVQVPLYNSAVAQSAWRSDIDMETVEHLQELDTWQWWNNFRCTADFNPKLKLVLEFNESDRPTEDVIRRWLGEPVEAVKLPSSMFIRNRHNFPVLPRAWQDVLAHFIRNHINIIVSVGMDDNSLKLYTEYLVNFRDMNKDSHELQS